MSILRAVFKFLIFALTCLIIVPMQALVLIFAKNQNAYIMPQLWHIIICTAFGLRVTIEGAPNKNQQTIYMANHISYLDIPLIGQMIRGSFVAKSEVENWPVFGFLAKLQRTAFIQRKSSEITKQKHSLQAKLNQGESLIIFPEGTSTDGREVLPFKSSLFSIALDSTQKDLYVQPVTITLNSVDGHPITTQEEREIYVWSRDMPINLAAHLWRFTKTSGAHLTLTFHPPLKARDFEDRKTLAKTCHDHVSMGLDLNIETAA